MEDVKEARAVANTVRMSPRKVRLIIDLIRGRDVKDAFAILSLMPNRASRAISKVLKSAAANAKNNYEMDEKALFVKETYANDGVTMKRYRARAKGRGDRILRRTSNIVVVVAERN